MITTRRIGRGMEEYFFGKEREREIVRGGYLESTKESFVKSYIRGGKTIPNIILGSSVLASIISREPGFAFFGAIASEAIRNGNTFAYNRKKSRHNLAQGNIDEVISRDGRETA